MSDFTVTPKHSLFTRTFWPLVLGLDVRNATVMDGVWDIISNREVIAVNQAYAGGSGTLVVQADANVTFPFCGSQYPSGCSLAAWQVLHRAWAWWKVAVPG